MGVFAGDCRNHRHPLRDAGVVTKASAPSGINGTASLAEPDFARRARASGEVTRPKASCLSTVRQGQYLGTGSGYFAIRLAPRVGPAGRVISVDVRRQPLAFPWIRRLIRRDWQIHIVLADDEDPRLGMERVDAVLVANTYHELADPAATLNALRAVLKPGGRLVVTDRRPRAGPGVSAQAERDRHTLSPAVAEAEVTSAGFQQVARDDAFIDRPDDEPWWLMVFASPPSATSPAGARD
jgi:predicted methyltransferase